MAQGICEALWIYRILKELKKMVQLPLKLYYDSKTAIIVAHNPIQHDRTKHIEINQHFIKENFEAETNCTVISFQSANI